MTRITGRLARASRAVRKAGIAGLAVVVAFAFADVPRAFAQESASRALAKELVTLMKERKLDAFAVQDPAKPGYFVAVRSYPDVQILIVGAESSSADYMLYQLDRKDYAEAYAALNASAVPDTKMFLQDMGCDGLQKEGEHVDVLYEKAQTQVLFDGSGKTSGLSKSTYAAKVAAADAHYSGMLAMLVDGLRKAPPGTEASK